MVENLIPSLDIPQIKHQDPPLLENLINPVPLSEKLPLAEEGLPPASRQETRASRRITLVSGSLVAILALFWWYQPSQLLSGSRLRTQEESAVREKKQQGSGETVLREMQLANLNTSQTAHSQLSDDKPSAAQVTPDSSRSDRYTIQVGAFGNQESARRVLSQLLEKGYSGRMGQLEMDANRYYHVWSGQFTNRAQASRIQTELKTDGFATYVRKVADQ